MATKVPKGQRKIKIFKFEKNTWLESPARASRTEMCVLDHISDQY